jgi:hypothetical protein
VGFDERLDPFVESVGGRKLRALPEPGASDDPVLVARAEEVWRELQEDVAAIADVRLTSLERAMVTGRSWMPDTFRRVWMEHPLMRHVSRSIIWRSGDVPFRIAEDGTFADSHDLELRTVTTIGAAHPAEMTTEELHRWTQVFADYRILQPIDQLSRRVVPAEAMTAAMKRDSVILLPPGSMPTSELYARLNAKHFTLTNEGGTPGATRPCVRGSGKLRLRLLFKNQKVERVELEPGKAHRVDVSEVAHDLELQATW